MAPPLVVAPEDVCPRCPADPPDRKLEVREQRWREGDALDGGARSDDCARRCAVLAGERLEIDDPSVDERNGRHRGAERRRIRGYGTGAADADGAAIKAGAVTPAATAPTTASAA